jgi:chemotaxis protein methyltransferase CheR
MDRLHFSFLASLLYKEAGLVFTDQKIYLLMSRLGPVARKRGFADVAPFVAELQKNPTRELVRDVVEAMTTNETSFFRDRTTFDALEKLILPAVTGPAKQRRELRIWSAACSTGQEAYSVAMLLEKAMVPADGTRIEIVGTDIDRCVLDRARDGIYTKFEIARGLPAEYQTRFFDLAGDGWKVRDKLKRHANFREFNLMNDPAQLGRFDIVFCRNVLIYFDTETKQKVIERLMSRLLPGGFLVLGSAETVFGCEKQLERLGGCGGVYRYIGAATGVAAPLRPAAPNLVPPSAVPARPAAAWSAPTPSPLRPIAKVA